MKTIKETLYIISINNELIRKQFESTEHFMIDGLERLSMDANTLSTSEFILEYGDALDYLNNDYTRPEIQRYCKNIA